MMKIKVLEVFADGMQKIVEREVPDNYFASETEEKKDVSERIAYLEEKISSVINILSALSGKKI